MLWNWICRMNPSLRRIIWGEQICCVFTWLKTCGKCHKKSRRCRDNVLASVDEFPSSHPNFFLFVLLKCHSKRLEDVSTLRVFRGSVIRRTMLQAGALGESGNSANFFNFCPRAHLDVSTFFIGSWKLVCIAADTAVLLKEWPRRLIKSYRKKSEAFCWYSDFGILKT